MVDPSPSAKLGSCMNLFGQPAWFVLCSKCHSVNISSLFSAWLSAFFATPPCLIKVHVHTLSTYYYGIFMVLLSIDFTHPHQPHAIWNSSIAGSPNALLSRAYRSHWSKVCCLIRSWLCYGQMLLGYLHWYTVSCSRLCFPFFCPSFLLLLILVSKGCDQHNTLILCLLDRVSS